MSYVMKGFKGDTFFFAFKRADWLFSKLFILDQFNMNEMQGPNQCICKITRGVVNINCLVTAILFFQRVIFVYVIYLEMNSPACWSKGLFPMRSKMSLKWKTNDINKSGGIS